MNNCGFCENLKNSIDLLKYDKQKHPKRHNGYKDEFYAAMIHKVFYNDEPAGYSDSASFPLNYCPECGRKIHNDETNT